MPNYCAGSCGQMDWKVHPRSLYKLFVPTEDDLSKPRGYLLAEADADGAVHNAMQLTVHGDEPIVVKFNTSDLFLEPELAGYEVTMEELPVSIKPQPNSSTTVWADFRDLVAKREVTVTREGEDATEQILQTLEQLRKQSYKRGAVLRWAIRADTTQTVILGLQGLPASIAHIKSRAQFSLDNCPAILLASTPLEMPLSRAGLVVGPPPTLFSPAPDETIESLKGDPTAALEGKAFYGQQSNI
jgi:hypothetical protein